MHSNYLLKSLEILKGYTNGYDGKLHVTCIFVILKKFLN